MWVWIGLAIVVAIVVVYWLIPWIKSPSKKAPLELSSAPVVADTASAQTMLLGGNTGTLRAFVYPLAYERTGQLTLCSTSTPSAPGEPECSTGRFNMCPCEGGSCDKCKHKGYANILNVSNIVRLEVLTVPDAARQKMAGCQLVVRTMRNPLPPHALQGRCPRGYYEFNKDKGGFCCPVEPTMDGTKCPSPILDTKQVCALDSSRTEGLPVCPAQLPEQGTILQEETLVLPDIPFQKWTMITIAREGRRFDIYYNDALVLSKRTQYMLASTATFGPIIAGDPNLSGKVTDVDVVKTKKNMQDVQADYAKLADTNGAPYLKGKDFFDYVPTCEGGSCLKGPTVRVESPLLDWDTNYA